MSGKLLTHRFGDDLRVNIPSFVIRFLGSGAFVFPDSTLLRVPARFDRLHAPFRTRSAGSDRLTGNFDEDGICMTRGHDSDSNPTGMLQLNIKIQFLNRAICGDRLRCNRDSVDDQFNWDSSCVTDARTLKVPLRFFVKTFGSDRFGLRCRFLGQQRRRLACYANFAGLFEIQLTGLPGRSRRPDLEAIHGKVE